MTPQQLREEAQRLLDKADAEEVAGVQIVLYRFVAPDLLIPMPDGRTLEVDLQYCRVSWRKSPHVDARQLTAEDLLKPLHTLREE